MAVQQLVSKNASQSEGEKMMMKKVPNQSKKNMRRAVDQKNLIDKRDLNDVKNSKDHMNSDETKYLKGQRN